jgi:acetylglutamate kinase
MKENMYYGAHPLIFQRAQELRAVITPAEEVVWNIIHFNPWDIKFRRQHPLANYVVDFYCHSLKLVIEIDGSVHQEEEVKRNDKHREDHLKELGLNVIRFSNKDVFSNTNLVFNQLDEIIKELKNIPNNHTATNSPLGAGGKHIPNNQVASNSPLGAGGKPSHTVTNSPLGAGGNRLFVIKIGGNVIDDDSSLNKFLADFAKIDTPKILIHGGGKIATKIGNDLGVESKYINGRRITDDDTIDLVTMVYGGLVNKKIVAKLQSYNCNAIGLTGADANIIPATKRPVKEIDYGWVGDIDHSQLTIHNLKLLLDANLTPVFAPLTHDGKGNILNTNADTIASALAVALSAEYNVRLVYCFEKRGVLKNINDENSVITSMNKQLYTQLVADKKLFEGIIPKIDNAFDAIDAGVHEVLIGHADDLLQNTTGKTSGTLIA